jgi:hypothetical protein
VPCEDVYERSGGTTTLISDPPGPGGNFDASFQGASSDGSHVFYGTSEPMVPGDTNAARDIYERAGASTIRVSVGPSGGGGLTAYPSRDGTRVVFSSPSKLLPEDIDGVADLYERYAGQTFLITDFANTALGTNFNFVQSTPDKTHLYFESSAAWVPEDGNDLCAPFSTPCEDLYESKITPVAGYPRPRGAGPLSVSLVPAFAPCTSPNRTHGAPLAFPACAPPVQTSGSLTVGTGDANGVGAASVGFVTLNAKPRSPDPDIEDADARITLSLTDVRSSGSLGDYTGELQGQVTVRLTDYDQWAPTTNPPQTVQDFPTTFTAPCAATASGTIGGTCNADTTADALVPGMVRKGNRAIWELGPVLVYDGGPDGDADTPGNTLFARQGIFIP